MGKFIGFVLCLALGFSILCLALIKDELSCSYNTGICTSQTRISYLNINLSKDLFPVSEVTKSYCSTAYQPARNGKKKYFVLKLVKTNGQEINLGTFKNRNMCKKETVPINNFVKGKIPSIYYDSGTGFSNITGFIFGILFFLIGFVILFTKSEPDEDFDENSEINDGSHANVSKDV